MLTFYLQEATSRAQKDSLFRAHPFYQMDVVLKEGRDLVIRDSCGAYLPPPLTVRAMSH